MTQRGASVAQVAIDIVMGKNTVTGVVQTAMGEVNQVVSKAASTTQQKIGAIGSACTSIGSAMLPASAAIGGMGVAAVRYASDTEESINKVDVAFGKSAGLVKQFGENSLQNFGMAKGSALDAAATFGDMATSMGLPQNAAADMATSLTGLGGDLASFKNIDVGQAMTALNGVFTGETESLKGLGVVMTQTNLDAFALASGFEKTTSEMTEAEKVNLRYAYVMNATKNAQGDFARTSDGTANAMRTSQESLKELAASMGEVLLPIVAEILGKVNEWIQKFASMDDRTKKVIMAIAGVIAVAGPFLIFIGKIATGISSIVGVVSKVVSVFKVLSSWIYVNTLDTKSRTNIMLLGELRPLFVEVFYIQVRCESFFYCTRILYTQRSLV